MATKKTVANKTKVSAAKVTLTVNEYDVPMLAIENITPRNVYISVKKAAAILATKENESLLKPTEKYGRELFHVDYGTGKGFNVGAAKLTAVLENAELIEKAIA